MPAVRIRRLVKAQRHRGGRAAINLFLRQRQAAGAFALADVFPVFRVTEGPAGIVGRLVEWGPVLAHLLAGGAAVVLRCLQRLLPILAAHRVPQVPIALRPAGRVVGGAIGHAGRLGVGVVVAEVLAFAVVVRLAR